MTTVVTEINDQADGDEAAYGKILDDQEHGIRSRDLQKVLAGEGFTDDDADPKGKAYVYMMQSTNDASKNRDEVRGVVEAWQNAFGRELKKLCVNYSENEEHVSRIRAILKAAQILTVVRKGAWGCEGTNRQLIKKLSGKEPEDDVAGVKPYAGLPIIITKNDKLLGVNNGDVGVVVRDHGELKVWIDGYSDGRNKGGAGDGLLSYRILPSYEPAYAITIHKSQGSQYDNVLVVLPPKKESAEAPWSPLMTKELVYTGITRAKKRAFVYGSKDGLLYALSHRSHRKTGRL